MLRDVLGYDPKRKARSYGKRTIMSIAGLDAWVATVAHCLEEKEKLEGPCQKEYVDT